MPNPIRSRTSTGRRRTNRRSKPAAIENRKRRFPYETHIYDHCLRAASCGHARRLRRTGSTNPFDAKAKTFSDDGMQITLTTAFSEEDLEGYTVGYAADTAIVLALHETKAEFADARAGRRDIRAVCRVLSGRRTSDKELVDGEPIDGNPDAAV